MPVRPTMSKIIQRVRLLVNDPSPNFTDTVVQFSDQDVQDVLDSTRQDMRYLVLAPAPTYSGSTLSYFDYYSDLGDWEDDLTLWQWRINQMTPATTDNIVGHWTFAKTTLPPVYITGKTFDIYRCAADLLERLSARWALSYSVSVDGQNLQRSQAFTMIQDLAHNYRLKQRAFAIGVTRGDLVNKAQNNSLGLGPLPVDYMGNGQGR